MDKSNPWKSYDHMRFVKLRLWSIDSRNEIDVLSLWASFVDTNASGTRSLGSDVHHKQARTGLWRLENCKGCVGDGRVNTSYSNPNFFRTEVQATGFVCLINGVMGKILCYIFIEQCTIKKRKQIHCWQRNMKEFFMVMHRQWGECAHNKV